MMKHEFENLAGDVTDENFKLIEFVYNFHPSIDEAVGKQQIADLFATFGMRVISDMYPTACKAKTLEEDIRKRTLELETLRDQLANLKKGDL